MNLKDFDELGQDICDTLNSNTSIFFLFGDKESTEFNINCDEDLFISIIETLINSNNNSKKVKLYWHEWGKGRLCASKNKKLFDKLGNIKHSNKKFSLVVGKYFGIPDCCIKKYIEDNNKDSSRESFIRYKRQLIDLKIKEDIYEIGWDVHSNKTVCNAVGFIPCHPHCKKAKKILKKLIRIKKRMGYKNAK